jgi:hypothetical protein
LCLLNWWYGKDSAGFWAFASSDFNTITNTAHISCIKTSTHQYINTSINTGTNTSMCQHTNTIPNASTQCWHCAYDLTLGS